MTVFLRSAVVSARSQRLHFIVFTDNLGAEVERQLRELNDTGLFPAITMDIREPAYPDMKKAKH